MSDCACLTRHGVSSSVYLTLINDDNGWTCLAKIPNVRDLEPFASYHNVWNWVFSFHNSYFEAELISPKPAIQKLKFFFT